MEIHLCTFINLEELVVGDFVEGLSFLAADGLVWVSAG